PTREVLDLAESPIKLFWYFVPKTLLHMIAKESNLYAKQTLLSRARRIRDKQLASKWRGTRVKEVESLKAIRERLRAMKPFEPHEYAHLIGLRVARMLCPHRRRLSSHWGTTSVGALPAGTFNAWMPRNR
ncbi:hypothetical protein PHYSODRAFT_422528, partial [Phytophthora sojae]